jgi:type IV secretory pathway TraG/TraD family ATPase VirD4
VKAKIEGHPSLTSVISYIGDGTGGQALGVYATLLATFRQLFTGVFADKGVFSIRDFVKKRGGRTLFIEYDISIGNILAPIYTLLFDLALKESLGRTHQSGNVYLICDEFRLLPYLQHIDDGVNFGRSLGVKILAGLQSINQLTEVYGEYRGKNIISGFSTIFSFKANDVFTRNFITDLHGKNLILEQYKSVANKIQEEKRTANVVEDWDMNGLEIGEAIISLPQGRPFKFKFGLYKQGTI